ncbi:hypothetical protein N0V85_009409, partial [Neurospora sp. IMI 360204]
LKDHVRSGCGVDADKIEVYAPLGGCVRIRARENFDKAFTRSDFLNGSILNGRALLADGRNKGRRVMVKPTIAVSLTVRSTAFLETDPTLVYEYGFSQGGAAGGIMPAFANMAISRSPAVYGAAQPYGGHVVVPYPQAALITSPYSVDPAYNPYASMGQLYNAHQSFNPGDVAPDYNQVYTQAYDGTIAAAVTPPIPVQAQRDNSIANSLASVPSSSTPTSTIINIGTPNIVNTVNTALTIPSLLPNTCNPPILLSTPSHGSHPLQFQRQEQQPRKIITDLSKKNLAAENVLGYKASKSGVVIANGSYPTTTADTTTGGNKDRSSGLLAMSPKANVVIARRSWATTSDKLPPKN